MIEKAKRRGHRKSGAEMGLFAFDTERVGPRPRNFLPTARDYYCGLRRR
jgi:threonyl-tRNA synthetase